MITATTPPSPTMCPNSPPLSMSQLGRPKKGATHAGRSSRHPTMTLRFQRRPAKPNKSVGRHAEPFSVNKSPDAAASSANFDSADSRRQKLHGGRLQVAPAMKQSQPRVVRDSKD